MSVTPSMKRILRVSEDIDAGRGDPFLDALKSWQTLLRHNDECLEWLMKVVQHFEAVQGHAPLNLGKPDMGVQGPPGADVSDSYKTFPAMGMAMEGLETAAGHSYRYFAEGRRALYDGAHSWGIPVPTTPVGAQEADIRHAKPEEMSLRAEEAAGYLERAAKNFQSAFSGFKSLETALEGVGPSPVGRSAAPRNVKAAFEKGLTFRDSIGKALAGVHGFLRRVTFVTNKTWGDDEYSARGMAVSWKSPWEDDPELGYREF